MKKRVFLIVILNCLSFLSLIFTQSSDKVTKASSIKGVGAAADPEQSCLLLGMDLTD